MAPLPPRARPAAWILPAAVALAAAPTQATTLRYLTAAELVAEADDVVHGTVASVEAQLTPDRSTIYTQVTLDVAEAFKGDAPAGELRFTLLGGEVEGSRVTYEGRPDFRAGEEVVVFLRRRDGGARILMALAQGKWSVARPGGTGAEPLLVRDLRAVRLPGTAPARPTMALSELRQLAASHP